MLFPGTPSPPANLSVYKEQAFCGSSVPDQSLLVAPDGGLKTSWSPCAGRVSTSRRDHPRPSSSTTSAAGSRPHVQAARVGSTLLLLNSDHILHDAHARMGPRTLFNDGLPRWRRVTRVLGRPGVIKIICELHHAWMSAYIVVAPNRSSP